MATKLNHVSIRFDDKTLRAIDRQAKSLGRTRANYLEWLALRELVVSAEQRRLAKASETVRTTKGTLTGIVKDDRSKRLVSNKGH